MAVTVSYRSIVVSATGSVGAGPRTSDPRFLLWMTETHNRYKRPGSIASVSIATWTVRCVMYLLLFSSSVMCVKWVSVYLAYGSTHGPSSVTLTIGRS